MKRGISLSLAFTSLIVILILILILILTNDSLSKLFKSSESSKEISNSILESAKLKCQEYCERAKTFSPSNWRSSAYCAQPFIIDTNPEYCFGEKINFKCSNINCGL